MHGSHPPTIPNYERDDFDPASLVDGGTRQFVEDLRRDGYAVLDLGSAALALCDQAIAETEPYFAGGDVRRVQDAWRRSPAVRALATLPMIQEKLLAAYGRIPFPFQTLNFRIGTEQATHSDMVHFNSEPERFMCGVWIALEDVKEDAGPLVYYAGSHRLPTVTMRDAGVRGRSRGRDYPKFEARFGELLSRSNLARRHAIIPKGHAFVWSAPLAHGGSAISREGSTRRSLVTHFYFEDCLYFTPLRSDVEGGRLFVRAPPDIRTGRRRFSRRDGKVVAPSILEMAAALRSALFNRPALARS